MNYEQGLDLLKQAVKDTQYVGDFALYEARLRENLASERRYGTTEQLRSTRSQIVEQLNALAREVGNSSFNDLCLAKPNVQRPGSSVMARTGDNYPIPQASRPNVVICSSREDDRYFKDLCTHLAYPKRQGLVNYWDVSQIRLGEDRRRETQKAVQSAKIAVLLISAYFFDNKEIMQYQLPLVFQAVEQRSLKIFNVIVRHSSFEQTELASLQSLNDPSTPLSALTSEKRDAMWASIARRIIENIQS